MQRREKLVTGETYHIFSKSIAGYKIFNNKREYLRIRDIVRYYQIEDVPLPYSRFITREEVQDNGFDDVFLAVSLERSKLVQIIAYCFMPTHIHLILKQLKKDGISIFMGNVLNSYSRYFNLKYKRKGPLWEGRFKNVLVDEDEQLLHLTRYIHLNPVTSYLVKKPEDWAASSYYEYLSGINIDGNRICEYENILDIEPSSYRKFTKNRISYQRELASIKKLLLEK